MCTAISYKMSDHYFGRNLDLERCYNEAVTITPRNYAFNFRELNSLKNHNSMIGVASVVDNYPLYYDATNEKGLSIAGLSFSENTHYNDICKGKINLAPFELIPYILGQCSCVDEARENLKSINLARINFSDNLPLTPLHWIVSDKKKSITVESVMEGLKIYDNPVGVLTNNPSFDMQIFNLNNYMTLSRSPTKNTFSNKLTLKAYSAGMGAIGLPGDSSSQSRFVKAAFNKLNSVSGTNEFDCVSQFFHILSSVEQIKGCVVLENGEFEYTHYTSCCNTDKQIYYYTTYENRQITGIDMHGFNLDGTQPISFPLIKEQQVRMVGY